MHRVLHLLVAVRFIASFGVATLTIGCGSGVPVTRTRPLTPPSAASAALLIVRERPAGVMVVATEFDVYDERGELLGRVPEGGWLAIERPPGMQRVFVTRGVVEACASVGSTAVGVLDVEFAAGRIYVARIATREEAFSFDFRCCASRTFSEPSVLLHIDLVGVRPGGEEWLRATRILERGRGVEPAPRGLEPYEGSERILALGAGRFEAGCIDRTRSRLDREDGSTTFPSRAPY